MQQQREITNQEKNSHIVNEEKPCQLENQEKQPISDFTQASSTDLPINIMTNSKHEEALTGPTTEHSNIYPTNCIKHPTSEQHFQPVSIQVSQPQRSVKVNAVLALGITQIVLGSLSIIFSLSIIVVGSSDESSLDGNGNFGIPAIFTAIWFMVTGILGVVSSRKPTSGCCNGTYLGFNVTACFFTLAISALMSFVIKMLTTCKKQQQIHLNPSNIFSPVVGTKTICTERDAGIALISCIMFCHGVGFMTALSAAILCCIFKCCGNQAEKVYVDPAQQMYTVPSPSIVVPSPHLYPPSTACTRVQPPAYYPNQPSIAQASYLPSGPNVTYSAGQPPKYQ